MIQKDRIFILIAVFVLVAGAIAYFERGKPPRLAPESVKELSASREPSALKSIRYPRAKEIVQPAGFLNTDSITIGEFIGKKVVLIDFWTYSCINCQRTFPYLTAWYKKYRDQGLEIIGIHTPEFKFEEERDNVQAAIKKFGIEYPVVQDNEYATWRAYENQYWPRKYLIDIDGFIVYDHIGEGAYEETEKKIQELLRERHAVLGEGEAVAGDMVNPAGVIDVDFAQVGSPETYFGALRNSNFENGKKAEVGAQALSLPATIGKNALYLDGIWGIEYEYAENQSAGAKIVFRYRAKNVYLVANSDTPIKMRILRDGKPVGNAGGADVVSSGGASVVTVKEDKLYHLIADPEGYGEHLLEIIIESPGVRAFAFTFG